jgi:hypothetical protein
MSQGRTLSWGDDDVAEARRRVGEVVERLPGTTVEVDDHGNTGFFTRGKRFAWVLPDHHGDGRLALWCKADRHEQQAIVARDPDRYFVAPYLGQHGWVAAHLDPAHSPDWDELEEIVETGWRMSATRAAVAAFDAEAGTAARRPSEQ